MFIGGEALHDVTRVIDLNDVTLMSGHFTHEMVAAELKLTKKTIRMLGSCNLCD